jgi:hypothetical protein
MDDNVYFDGDPATESTRRHLERVLNEPERRRPRWPWVVASVAAVAAWYFWPRGRSGQISTQTGARRERDRDEDSPAHADVPLDHAP